jgi:hypothetical protein
MGIVLAGMTLHVPGIPNDLYRGSPTAPKQGFDFDRDLHQELENQVLDYGTSFPRYRLP